MTKGRMLNSDWLLTAAKVDAGSGTLRMTAQELAWIASLILDCAVSEQQVVDSIRAALKRAGL